MRQSVKKLFCDLIHAYIFTRFLPYINHDLHSSMSILLQHAARSSIMMTKLVKILITHSHRILTVNLRGSSAYFTTSATCWQYDPVRYDPQYCRYKRKLENGRCERKLERLKPSEKERLRKLQIEYEVLKAEGYTEAPDEMDACEWCDILEERNEEDRFSRYRYIKSDQTVLQERERHDLQMSHQLETYIQRLKESGQTENVHMHIDEACLQNRQHLQNICSDLIGHNFSRDIIIELPQIDWLVRRGKFDARMKAVLQNLRIILQMNRKHIQPCNFHISNCGEMLNSLQFQTDISSLRKDFPFVTFYEANILDIFNKDRLVYITPWSTNVLEDDANDIPILLLSDRQNLSRSIQRIADSNGIRQARFPLQKYVRFTGRNRFDFSVVESVGVLQDLYLHHNWTQAFTNNMLVPKSKYFTQAEFQMYTYKSREKHKQKYKKKISTKIVNESVKNVIYKKKS